MSDLFGTQTISSTAPSYRPQRAAVKRPVLRDYQVKGIERIFEEWKDAQSTLVVAATGTGKTTVFCEVARRITGRTMVIAHREELITQAARRLHTFGLDVEIEMADQIAPEYMQPKVIVATVQTLSSGRMGRFSPRDFDCLIVDEAHHAAADSYKRVMRHFAQNPDLRILGVTATPDRADEAALGQVFDTVAFTYDVMDAINGGWLVPIEQQMVQVDSLDFSTVRTVAGDLNGADLSALMEAESNLHGVASATLDIAGNRQTIVFTASVKQAEMLSDIFNRHQPGSSDWVCGTTPKDMRRETTRKFANKQLRRLVNCGVFTEGFDDPGIEVVVQAKPTKSRALYAQIIGRGTRPLPGVVDGLGTAAERVEAIAASRKPALLVIDFAGNAGKHKLVTTADILGEKLEDDVVEIAAAKVREAGKTGKSLRMDEALQQAQREAEELRRQAEIARKAKLVGKASFRSESVSPFEVFHITPHKARGWDNVKKPSEKMRAVLAKNGINPDDLSFIQSKQLISEIFRRREVGLCSAKQAKLLTKHGYDASAVGFKEASELINALAANHWKRPA